MLQFSGRCIPVTRGHMFHASFCPPSCLGWRSWHGRVSDSSTVGQRLRTREVRREPRGCNAEQPRWVQPVGDVPSLLPLLAWVTRSTSGCATGKGKARVLEIWVRNPPQPPACLSAQGPRCGRLPCAAEFGAGG